MFRVGRYNIMNNYSDECFLICDVCWL